MPMMSDINSIGAAGSGVGSGVGVAVGVAVGNGVGVGVGSASHATINPRRSATAITTTAGRANVANSDREWLNVSISPPGSLGLFNYHSSL